MTPEITKSQGESGWEAPFGAVMTIILLASLGLVAIGGWNWFTSFLSNQAAGWVQAVGSIAAILAAHHMGRTQMAADREIESIRVSSEDRRKLITIIAIIENLELQVSAVRRQHNGYRIPIFSFIQKESIVDSCNAVAAIDLFSCPSPAVIAPLARIPRQIRNLLVCIEKFDYSINEMTGQTDDASDVLYNALTVTEMDLSECRSACANSVAALPS